MLHGLRTKAEDLARAAPSSRMALLGLVLGSSLANALAKSAGPLHRSGRGVRRFKSCHSDQHLAKIVARAANSSANSSRNVVRTIGEFSCLFIEAWRSRS